MKAVIMPKMGFTMTESTIVQWLKKDGDAVEQGEPIAEVTTDKVNMEVEAPDNGILAGLKYKEGDTVAVTEIIAYVLKPGEALPTTDDRRPTIASSSPHPLISSPPTTLSPVVPKSATPIALRMAQELGIDLGAVSGSGPGGKVTREDIEAAAKARAAVSQTAPLSALKAEVSPEVAAHVEPTPRSETRATPMTHVAPTFPSEMRAAPASMEPALPDKVRATPAARRAAREQAVDLASLRGSGPNARVQASDVRVASSVTPQPAMPATPPSPALAIASRSMSAAQSSIPYAGMRKTIGTRLTQSYQELPHITFDADADVSAAERLRAKANAALKAGQGKISLTAIVVKACAWALARHPLINSRLDLAAGQIYLLDEIHIGVAVALDNGLVVPVIRRPNQKGIQQVANELNDMAGRAKTNKLKADELQGATFSISNLGMYGVTRFTAIINPPETAILAVGAARKQFVPDEQERPVLRALLGLRLSADHRVIDGAVAAQFLADITAAIEDPAQMAL